jgi:hypothetical protein
MTRDELYQILRNYVGRDAEALHAVGEIWGQPFDGETEKINTTKSASLTSAIPQTNPAPQKTEWARRVIADVTTREGKIIRAMSGWQNTATPTQPQ